ncbi:MAG: hypothetical protein JKX91_12420 [Rhizobiaceae bacterium]|nr:hypothetical protein [Rhizobiaceae bacterium]
MSNAILSSLEEAEPPQGLSAPLQALWWLKKGDLAMGPEWEKGHGICQTAEGVHDYDWVHALSHWIEGDMGNASYWYRRISKERVGANLLDEWDHIVSELSAAT